MHVANAAGGAPVDLSPGKTIVTYFDANQALTFATGDITIMGLGNADSDNLVEPGEVYEMKISSLVYILKPDLKRILIS